MMYVKFYDHFVSDAGDENVCTLETVGWKVDENEVYLKLSSCRVDATEFKDGFFNILKSAIIEQKELAC